MRLEEIRRWISGGKVVNCGWGDDESGAGGSCGCGCGCGCEGFGSDPESGLPEEEEEDDRGGMARRRRRFADTMVFPGSPFLFFTQNGVIVIISLIRVVG